MKQISKGDDIARIKIGRLAMRDLIETIKKTKEYCIGIVFLILGVGPYIALIRYIVPAADDYCYAYDIYNAGGHSIWGVFNLIKTYFMRWEGPYTSIGLIAACDPITRMGRNGVKPFLLSTIVLFVFVIFFASYQLCKIFYSKKHSFLVSSIFIFSIMNCQVLVENLLWFTGMCYYPVGIITGLFTIMCACVVIKEKNSKKKRMIFTALGALAGILTSGTNLQIVGYFCFVLMLFFVWSFIKKQHFLYLSCVFGFTVLGALINTLAPGNYNRQSVSYESISVFKALYYTVISVANEVIRLQSSTYLPWILLLIFVFAMIYIKPINNKNLNPFVVGILALIGCLISTFPVCYGYADSSLAKRGYEVLDIFLIIGMVLFLNCLANWLKCKKIILSANSIMILTIFATISICYLFKYVPLNEVPVIRSVQEIASGELKEYYDEWCVVLDAIETSEEAIVEVKISRKAYDARMIIMSPGISENFEKWVNGGMAQYFGKEKIRVIVEE